VAAGTDILVCAMPSYKDAVRARAKADVEAVHTGVHLLWGVVPAIGTAAIGFFLERWMSVAILSRAGRLMPLLAGCLAFGLWYYGVTVYYRLRAPRKVCEILQSELSDAETALACARDAEVALRREHAERVGALQREHASAIDCASAGTRVGPPHRNSVYCPTLTVLGSARVSCENRSRPSR
jgi:hypothetical protein